MALGSLLSYLTGYIVALKPQEFSQKLLNWPMPVIEMPDMKRTIRPKNIMPIKPLTNQELLSELERRMEQGTIKLEFDTKQVEPQANEVPETKIFGLSKSTLILGLGVMAVLAFYFSSKSTLPVGIQTTVKISPKSTV